jgi:hypothetical protein
MKRSVITLTLVTSLLFQFALPVSADNANPPRITSVEQVTTGPYSVGDIVTFKVGYEGGYPGIDRIMISLGCIRNLHSSGANVGNFIGWSKQERITSFAGNGLVSGYVAPCQHSEVQPSFIQITDETGLRASLSWDELKLNSALKLQINKSDLLPTPIGEIKPIKIPDEVTLGVSSKLGLNQVFALPRLTKSGAPLFFRTMTKRVCEIDWETFQGDLGGNLRTLSPGICAIRIMVSSSDKYENPTIKTDKITKPSSSSITVLNFTVSKASKSKR